MYQTEHDIREERRRRLLYIIFGLGVGVAVLICAVVGFLAFLPQSALVRLGPEKRFATAGTTPIDVPVKQLSISELIPNRPALSQDVIFIVRDRGALRAFLGTDPSSGCFLSWQVDQQLFVDACAQHSYGFTGRNTNQLATGTSRPVNMVELPVQVKDGILFVEDRFLRRDLR
jgi:hypothetical protein